MKGGPLVSPGVVCYTGKQEKSFWYSSFGQMVQFDTIIIGRTFENYYGQFVWIQKKCHYNSRVSLHESPTKNTSETSFVQGNATLVIVSENVNGVPDRNFGSSKENFMLRH